MFNRHNNFLKKICADFGLTPAGIEYALQQYQTVICELTNSRLSKLTYSANIVCQEAYNCFEDDFKENNKPEWISVKDRLPDSDGLYIVYGCSDAMKKLLPTCVPIWLCTFSKKRNGWHEDDLRIADDFIAYWMPLPEPPKEAT